MCNNAHIPEQESLRDQQKKRKKAARFLPFCILLPIVLLGFGIRSFSFFLPTQNDICGEIYRDASGEPYLIDTDSYFYLRMAEQMAETGHPFLYLQVSEDPLRGARQNIDAATPADPMLLPLITWGIWRILSSLFPVTVLQVSRWIGPVFGSLAAIPVFLYLQKRAGLFGAVVSALFIETAIPLVSGTVSGVFDTDALLGLLPLSMMLFFLRSLQAASLKKQLLYGFCTACSFALIAALWTGSFAYFWLLLITGLLCCLFSSRSRDRKIPLRGLFFSVLPSLLFLFLLRGTNGVMSLVQSLSAAAALQPRPDSLPSAFLFTSEMHPLRFLPVISGGKILSLFGANQDSILGRLGGISIFLTALAGLPLTAWHPPRHQSDPSGSVSSGTARALRSEAAVLLPWFLGSLILSVLARRFAKVTVLPLAVLAGLAAGSIANWPSLKKDRWRPFFCMFFLALWVVPSGLYSVLFSTNDLPSATDSLHQAMAEVRNSTEDSAVITGWWDDGYFMEATARRRCIGDGMTDSSAACAARIVLTAKALLTEDPVRMQGIFRMLENAGAVPFVRLTDWGFSQSEAMDLLLKLASAAPSPERVGIAADDETWAAETSAEDLMKQAGLSASQCVELSSLLFPADQPPILLALSSDLLAKWIPLAYYGLWDPAAGQSKAASGIQVSRQSVSLRPGEACTLHMGADEASLVLRADASGLPIIDEASDPRFLQCASVSVWQEGQLLRRNESGNPGSDLILLIEGDRICAFVCGNSLQNSMLVRLFICKDRSLSSFRLLTEVLSRATEEEPCSAQRRLIHDDPAAWCTQVWQLLPES